MQKIVCFNGPFEKNGYLNNWYIADFIKYGLRFSSVQQYMGFKTIMLFQDAGVDPYILAASDTNTIKETDCPVKNYIEDVWSSVSQMVMYEGILEKFRQNKDLRDKLLATQPDILAMCKAEDKILGIGLSMKDDRRFQMSEWQGQNLLGFTLMMVRAELSEK